MDINKRANVFGSKTSRRRWTKRWRKTVKKSRNSTYPGTLEPTPQREAWASQSFRWVRIQLGRHSKRKLKVS